MNSIEGAALKFAIKAHGDQKYGKHPYSYHLKGVAEVYKEFYGYDPVELAVCYLHDVLEDTDTYRQEIEMEFGKHIGAAVIALTDSVGPNRRDRHINTYFRIRNNPVALRVKLCDRLFNMRQSLDGKLAEMYVSEYYDFKFALYDASICPAIDTIWMELDNVYKQLKDKITKNPLEDLFDE